MLIKLPGGELRDELECSFAFKGKVGETLNLVDDHGYFYDKPFFHPKPAHSFRFQVLEITTEVPAKVEFVFLPHETPAKEKGIWQVETYLQRDLNGVTKTWPHNQTFIDICPTQWFELRTKPMTEGQTGEILVLFHGLMRKPIC